MSETGEKYDLHFYQLVISLHAGAMQQMGKVASPFTGKVERDLPMAKNTIDMLEMIRLKTDGNLNDEERQLIERVLYELRMNYVDESKRPDPQPESDKPDEDGRSEPAAPGDSSEESSDEDSGS
jgi:hypothetical protein